MQYTFEMYWKRKGKDPMKIVNNYKLDKTETGSDKKNDVSLNTQGGKSRLFKGTCNLCGKQDHKKADCWEDEKNKDKRPANWKSKLNNDVGMNAQDNRSNGAKCALCGENHDIKKYFYNPFNPNNNPKDPELANNENDNDEKQDSDVDFNTLCLKDNCEKAFKSIRRSTGNAYNTVKGFDLGDYFPGMKREEIRDCVWIADSGVSTHM